LAKPPLAWPGKRLGEGDAVEARLHAAHFDAFEAVVLKAQGQRRVGQDTGLGHALLIHPHGGIRLLKVRMPVQRLAQQIGQDGVGT
jgi:hypothetical protein